MQMALELAARGRGFTAPNPMVGAVVVKNRKVVGRGYHEAVGKAHAEVNAINDAGQAARGGTLYVTLEPCNHTGRTPPCTHKILQAGIERVVVAMTDPNPDVDGNGIGYLRQQGLTVEPGVAELQARELNEAYLKFVRTKRPFVILKYAATLDGRIATRTGDSKWISGEASRRFVHQLRHAVDAIMVGAGTVIADNPRLTTRLADRQAADPTRIILDPSLTIPRRAAVLHSDSKAETWLVSGPSIPAAERQVLERPGVRLISTPLRNGRIDLNLLMTELGRANVTSLLIEGGARVIASALKAGIVDKLYLFYAPKFLGGDDGVPICRGEGPDLMSDCLSVDVERIHRFDQDLMIEAYMNKTGHG